MATLPRGPGWRPTRGPVLKKAPSYYREGLRQLRASAQNIEVVTANPTPTARTTSQNIEVVAANPTATSRVTSQNLEIVCNSYIDPKRGSVRQSIFRPGDRPRWPMSIRKPAYPIITNFPTSRGYFIG